MALINMNYRRIYNHMTRPSDIRSTTDYHLFKDGIKPTWEDPQNKNGGKWMVKFMIYFYISQYDVSLCIGETEKRISFGSMGRNRIVCDWRTV
jgi:hypothetical protein